MARFLESKLEKLERGSGNMNAPPFYILWVETGADRQGALAAFRESGKISADVPAYCAAWQMPKEWERQGNPLGPRPRSRLTNHQRIDDDEKRILWETIGDEAEAVLKGAPRAKPEERTRQILVNMTDRELIGAIIGSGSLTRA